MRRGPCTSSCNSSWRWTSPTWRSSRWRRCPASWTSRGAHWTSGLRPCQLLEGENVLISVVPMTFNDYSNWQYFHVNNENISQGSPGTLGVVHSFMATERKGCSEAVREWGWQGWSLTWKKGLFKARVKIETEPRAWRPAVTFYSSPIDNWLARAALPSGPGRAEHHQIVCWSISQPQLELVVTGGDWQDNWQLS